MRLRATLMALLVLASPAHAQSTGAWGTKGLASMPDARVGADREFELGTRLVAIGGLPTAVLGYGRISMLSTDATVLAGIPAHPWPSLTLKHQLQRPTLANPTAVAVGVGLLGAPAVKGIPGNQAFIVLTRDVNLHQQGRDWTLFSAHLGFQADLSLQSRLMAGLELPLGQHGTVTAEWIGSQGSESGYANFALNLSPLPALDLSLFSLGLPNASLFDRGLAIGASFSGTLPAWSPPRAAAPSPTPRPVAVKPTSTPIPAPPPVKATPTPLPALPSVPSLPMATAGSGATASVAIAPKPSPLPSPALPVKPPEPPMGTVIGRALGENGLPLGEAHVTLVAPGQPSRETPTTASGYFTFAELPPGTYTVTLKGEDGKPRASRSLMVGGEPVEVTLKPQALAQLKGQVVDAARGSALAKASIAVGKQRATSDADGYFQLDGLPPGPWTVTVQASGYASATLQAKETQGRFALKPLPGTVGGRATTAAGKPVVGAVAQLGSLKAATDPQGRFALADVPAGDHSLTLTQDGRTLFSASVQVPPGGKVTRNVTIPEAAPSGRFGMISGRVRSAAGQPLKGVKVVVEGQAVTVLTVSDEHGRFSVLDLLPGTYRVSLSKAAYSAQEAPAVVKVGSPATLDVVLKGR